MSGLNQGKISIIVPVYNVERYLSECIESLMHQSYKDLEIILIDDESPDTCGRICDDYAEKDSRIIVIHKKNGGAASARNEGLKRAAGDYLAFVDSDDYLELDALENMLATMKRYDADVVQGAFRDVYLDHKNDRIRLEKEAAFETKEYLCRYTTDWTCGLAWDKLFRRAVLENVFYETGHAIDDEFFTYQGIMNAKKIVYTPTVVYNYRKRCSSVMNNAAAERMLFDRLDYSTKRRKKIVERFPELKQTFDYAYLNSLLVWLKDPALTVSVANEIKQLIKHYFWENKPCKMSVAFILQLLLTCMTSSEKLVKKKAQESITQTEIVYYE